MGDVNYFGIGVSETEITNLIKTEITENKTLEVFILDGNLSWHHQPSAFRHIQDGDVVHMTEEEAKQWFAKETKGKKQWVP